MYTGTGYVLIEKIFTETVYNESNHTDWVQMKTYYYREDGSVKDEYIYSRNNGGTAVTDTTTVTVSDIIITTPAPTTAIPNPIQTSCIITKISNTATAGGSYNKAQRVTTDIQGNVLKVETSNNAVNLDVDNYSVANAGNYNFTVQNSYTYLNSNLVQTVTDKASRVTSFGYDTADFKLNTVVKNDITGLNNDAAYNANINSSSLENHIQYNADKTISNLFTRNADGRWIAENYSYDWIGTAIKKKTVFDLSGITDISSDAVPGAVISYEFNDAGVQNKVILPNGEGITTTYNISGQMDTLASSYGNAKYAYDVDGRLKGYFRGKPADIRMVQTYFDYDMTGKLTELTNVGMPDVTTPDIAPVISTNSVKSIFNGFNYDICGRLTSYNAQVDSLSATSRHITFTYDGRGQLTGENHEKINSATNGLWANMVYNYDTAGSGVNLAGITRTIGNVTTPSVSLIFDTHNRVTGNTNYEFKDTTGNPVKYNGCDMVYDAEDRLIKVTKPTATPSILLTCGYYADGKRAWKQADESNRTTTNLSNTRTYFLYDGDQLLCEVKYDSAITTNDKYYVTAINLWGADGLAGRAVKTGTGTSAINYATTWYAYDQQGTVAQRYDANGTLANVYACDAFGNTLAGVEEVYSYNAQSGYYYDSETNFYYCMHRYYDPANGRWLTEDPIGFEGGMNLYGYCGNGPVGSVDESGLIKEYWYNNSIWTKDIINGGIRYTSNTDGSWYDIGNRLYNNKDEKLNVKVQAWSLPWNKQETAYIIVGDVRTNRLQEAVNWGVNRDINAYTKKFTELGYKVIVKRDASFDDITSILSDSSLQSIMFIGHNDSERGTISTYETNVLNETSIVPTTISAQLHGRHLQYAVCHVCFSNLPERGTGKYLKDALVGKIGKWEGTYGGWSPITGGIQPGGISQVTGQYYGLGFKLKYYRFKIADFITR